MMQSAVSLHACLPACLELLIIQPLDSVALQELKLSTSNDRPADSVAITQLMLAVMTKDETPAHLCRRLPPHLHHQLSHG